MDKKMGIGFEDVICCSFNNLESINYMKIMADKKRNVCKRVWADSFIFKSNASVHVRICISKVTQFGQG